MRQAGNKGRVLAAFFLSLLLTGLYFAWICGNIPIVYDINDDVAMRNVAAGVITGTPDAHLLHIKYLLGLVISSLYRGFPGLDWYGIVMIGIVLFSFAMVLYRGLAAQKPFSWKIFYTLLWFVLFNFLGMKHIVEFQWTVTAAMAGSAGIFLFYTSQTQDRFQSILEEGIAVFLLLLSLAVRDDVFLMILPVAVLCFWWKYGSLKRNGRLPVTLCHPAVPAALVLGVVLILAVEAFAYRSPEWKEFRAYNVNREAIMDYYGIPTYEEDPEIYEELDMTAQEAENLQRYSLYLTDDLYSEKMAALAEYAKKVYLEQHPVRERMKTALSDIREHLTKETYYGTNYLCFAMILFAAAVCLRKNRRQLGLVIVVLAVWGVYWLYLGYRDRILERVGFALYLLAFLTMLAVWYRVIFLEIQPPEAQKAVRRRRAGQVAAACLCVLLAVAGIRAVQRIRSDVSWRWSYNQEFLDVNRYMAEHEENVYFMTTFSIETYTDNFTVSRDFAFSNLLSVGGWHTFSPLENEKAAKLGITDAKHDIPQKDNVYVISLENINLRYMDRYYTSLYGEAYLGRELVERLDYGERVFEVYKFRVSK